jgi:hypothetical protein
MRLALAAEEADPRAAAEAWRRSWDAWLGLFAGGDGPPADARRLLVDHLLELHRHRVNDHLSRDELEPAGDYWRLVGGLPALASFRAPGLGEELAAAARRFRDELVTEYLLTTREAMRFGDIPEGWRADYERGLALLGRLAALEGDSVRLLTALVETCVEWFLDLYHLHDARRMASVVDRFSPWARRLAELVEGREGEVPARSALSEFWKFRGFVAASPAEKIELYREALRLNPANGNVRELLAGLGVGDA